MNAPICVCGDQMKLRRGPRGSFYGCQNFPKCHHTEPIDDDDSDE